MSSEIRLASRYEGAQSKHPELEEISPEALARLEARLSIQNTRTRTADFVIPLTLLPVGYVGVAVGIAMSERFVGSVAKRLAGYDYAQTIASVPGLRIGLILGIFTALIYFLVMPFMGRGPKAHPTLLQYTDWTNKKFAIASVVSLYVAFGAAILLVASLLSNSRLMEILFYIWFVPPGFLLALAPIGILVVGIRLQQNLRSKGSTDDLQVTEQLLSLLDDWPRLLNRIDDDFKRDISGRIKAISESIRRLYFKTPSDRSEEWSAEQMHLAADNLLVCISWLYVPQTTTIESIRLRLVSYCNAFLTGTLHNLPRNALTELDGFKLPRRRQRIMRTVSTTLAILTYLLLPLVIYFLLRSRVQQFSVPDSFLILLYSLWIAVGIYAYLEQTSQSGMATLLDLVRGMFGKKG